MGEGLNTQREMIEDMTTVPTSTSTYYYCKNRFGLPDCGHKHKTVEATERCHARLYANLKRANSGNSLTNILDQWTVEAVAGV